MTIEWSDKNKYNSFSSYKGLTYYENYKAIAEWLDGKDYLPPPIECSLDPIAQCNFRCYYCNSQGYLRDDRERMSGKRLTGTQMKNLIDFLAQWGVRGLCWGGGGESTLNGAIHGLTDYAVSKGMEVSLVTNGSVLDNALIEELMLCRWIGVSLDAGDHETFKKIKGVDSFENVVTNIRKLVRKKIETDSKVDISCKVLVLPENMDSLYECCCLAKKLGVQDFHVRPVDLERKDYKMARKLNIDIPKIKDIFNWCHQEETEDFRVFTVMHKYDEEFHVKHDFNKCLASPLVIQCCTDGNCYVCVDHRVEHRFRLGAFLPNPWEIKNWWGGESHRQLVKSINPHKECARCTWSEYNRQISEVVINDSMCVNFP